MLIAGGSGVVPLMSMLRTRQMARDPGRACLLSSSRSFDPILYRTEFEELSTLSGAPAIVHTLTRGPPPGWIAEHGCVGETMLAPPATAADTDPHTSRRGHTPL